MGADLAPGMRVGRYQLLFRLGKGGMGEVWAASQNQEHLGFHKLVALKVLRTRDLQSNAAVMFFDEAKAASALQHAAIVSTTDLGQDQDLLYIGMDLVQGPSLTALLQRLVITRKTMTPAMVAYIGMNLASALDYAHDRALVNGQPLKLVHRDVSPHNVLIDLNGAIRLTDFGVARTAIQDHKSQVGTVRGKPSYMAPEQVVGGNIDARTDLFALGIVLYESSCLKRLFGRSQPVKSMDAVIKHTPRPLPELVPDFPQTLWAVIRKALQKDSAKRFQSAAEMHDALSQAARGLDDHESAPRDLVKLIRRVFEEDAFDTEARVQAALAQAAPLEASAEPTTNQRPDEAIEVVGAEASRAAWPSADASDPLAPEAIEQAKTQYRAMTPSMPVPAMMHSGSVDAITPHGTQHSFTGFAPAPTKRNPWPAAALTAAALLLVGTTAFVISANTGDPGALPAEAPAALEVRPSAQPGAPMAAPSPQPRRGPPPVAEVMEPERAEPAPPAAPPPRRRRVATKTPKTEPPTAPKVEDATWQEVRGLLKKVKAVDPDRAGAMLATLAEAGKTNTDKLNQLRREAQLILARAPP